MCVYTAFAVYLYILHYGKYMDEQHFSEGVLNTEQLSCIYQQFYFDWAHFCLSDSARI